MPDTTEQQMLIRFLDALKQASGSAHQLAHAQQNPRWLQVRDNLEVLRTTAATMASSRPMARSEVISRLNERQSKVKVN